MIGRWLRLARGQVRIRVSGAGMTRFLNVCAQNDLTLRRIRRTDWNELYATISVDDFRALRRYMGRTGCRVHIVRRRGAPFLMARLWPRRVLWGGFFVLALLLWLLSTRIWAIELRFDPSLPRAEILEQFETLGVQIGVRRDSINTKRVRWQILAQYPQISFLALNIQGNRLTIEAHAADEPEPQLDDDAVVKVVAARDGVVQNVLTQSGQPMVQPGDAVETGDTLISGLVPPTREEGSYRLTHARGEVQAYTAYHLTSMRALETQEKHYTGRVKRQFALVFGNWRLNLYFGSGIRGDSCDKIVETKTAWLSDSVVFPVSLVVQTYVYYECETQTRTAEDVQQQMTERALAAVTEGMDGEVTSYSAQVQEQDGAAVLTLTAHALEQIGVEALDDSTIPEPEPPDAVQDGQ